MSIRQNCCITGHRNISPEIIPWLQKRLRQEIEFTMQNGCTHFLCGFAAGADMLFASMIAELKRSYPITLEAVIPYANRMHTSDIQFQHLIRLCDLVKIQSQYFYKGCFMARNQYMVNSSCFVIAVYDGRKTGGTASTLAYARRSGRIIREIRLDKSPEPR